MTAKIARRPRTSDNTITTKNKHKWRCVNWTRPARCLWAGSPKHGHEKTKTFLTFTKHSWHCIVLARTKLPSTHSARKNTARMQYKDSQRTTLKWHMSREEMRKRVCTKLRNNPVRQRKECAHACPGEKNNLRWRQRRRPDSQGQSHFSPRHSCGFSHANRSEMRMPRQNTLHENSTYSSTKSILCKTASKRPTCAVLKLTPHTAVVGSTFPGVLSQKQILQLSATQREKRPGTRRKLQTSADLPTEFVRFFSLNSVGSQRPPAAPVPSPVFLRAVLLMDYQLAGTLMPVTIKGCYTFQVGERF